MKRFCSIISCFLAITILISSSVVTAHAASVSPFTAPFWVWAGNKAQEEATSDEGYVGYLDYLKAAFSRKDSGCTSSQSKNGCHYWQLISDLPVSSITGKFRIKCQYCGMYYADYSSCDPEKEAETAYSNNVSTLPATGYDSAGKLLWQPRWSDTKAGEWTYQIYNNGQSVYLLQSVDGNPVFTNNALDTIIMSGSKITVQSKLQKAFRLYVSLYSGSGHEFVVPVSGKYTLLESVQCQVGYTQTTGSQVSGIDVKYSAGSSKVLYSGETYRISQIYSTGNRYSFLTGYNAEKGIFEFYTPVFSVEPSETSLVNNNYTINTRVNNFQGDYYNNVTNNYYNNTTIINETTNNYYDMTTNNYYTMSNWSYDYQSRTYFVTLEDGTTITVQFGDDCLTITNNNVENSYQYVINNNTPSPNPETPAACKHNWTETIDVAPTCLEGGHANFTCSLCGETYEQILSAKGHNWTVKEHVNTVYGESGVIVTQGHTLYECSACGEQWYTETATPPPDVSGGTNILAWLQSFQTWLGVQLELVIDKIQVTINNTETNIENVTNVVIEKTNNAYNVFYVTTEDGDEKPIGKVAGDTLSASGKLLNFLYKLCFEGALSKVDDSISAMDGFYFDNGAGLEGNVWD